MSRSGALGTIHDAVIVGAGLAGLSCAVDLHEAGYDVVVLRQRTAWAVGSAPTRTTSSSSIAVSSCSTPPTRHCAGSSTSRHST